MTVTLIRLLILYILILFSMRLMGRRQIGEMQISELIITILLSEIIVMPIEDNDIPILNSVVSVFVLTATEVLLSALSMKAPKIRKLLQGNPVPVIENGVLNQQALKKLRITMDDLLEALRGKDVFNLDDVEYAVMESNGTISVELKAPLQPPTKKDIKIKSEETGTIYTIISDGKQQKDNMKKCNLTKQKMDKILLQSGLKTEDIFLMTANKNGMVSCIPKEKRQ